VATNILFAGRLIRRSERLPCCTDFNQLGA
jgi:hypothetical protein